MKIVGYFFIVLDWIDLNIIDHRFYWLCDFIARNYPEDDKQC